MPADLDLAVNCGSSSIKFSLFNRSSRSVVVSGSASNVQGDSAASYKFTFSGEGGKEEKHEKELDKNTSYEDVFKEILQDVTAEKVLGSEGKGRIHLVAHRIVHGGTADGPILIRHGDKEEKEVLDQMEQVSSFAPLHNHHAMLIVKECLEHLPDATSVLCFDTLFHRTIPQYRRSYAISTPEHKTPVPLVKYGFHGLSYANILDQMAEELRKPKEEVNLVIAHLGSGGSCCLIQNGQSTQTTMGVTPLEGLPGGTRSGTIDPSMIFHHTPDCSDTVKWSGRDITKAEYILNKESGFRALCGTNNFGTITSRAFPSSDDKQPTEEEFQSARLTYELYLDHLLSFLSSYITSVFSSRTNSTLDGLVFSGGIGERSVRLRRDVVEHFKWIEELAGTQGGIDDEKNAEGKSGRREITKEGSKVRAWVVETSEEDEMIRMSEEEMDKAGR
ncbi:acetate kinase [Rhodotorula toruloides ATCC 204091]|uniref:Probable acetate kinase n=1 Tax=Rhodotorula toruloides TaxID=5286 RepID=A0A0K3C947_RHOTO|nr:acetate kinase [Rhodotorula toruloides ATCC 204091]KAK4334961.1 putative acetate kinase [Rhodotorula toruloides]PRQ76361.1 acetate kinase [Rhodotorula toruloides]